MTTSANAVPKTWAEIAAMPQDEQVPLIKQGYEALARLNEVDRATAVYRLEEGLYRLEDDLVRSFTRSRLRALLAMEPEMARVVTAPYPGLIDKLPGHMAMRHVAAIQTGGREFSVEQQARLREMFPRAFASRADGAFRVTKPEEMAQRRDAAKPWWSFWKKA